MLPAILTTFLILTAATAGTLAVQTLNPIHSLLNFIYVYICLGLILILSGSALVGLIFLNVYIGAIAVLFLFVIMLLGEREEYANETRRHQISGWLLLFSAISSNAAIMLYAWWWPTANRVVLGCLIPVSSQPAHLLYSSPQILNIGYFLYGYAILLLLIGGTILFLAMIAAIFLTLQPRAAILRQHTFQQHTRLTSIRSFASEN